MRYRVKWYLCDISKVNNKHPVPTNCACSYDSKIRPARGRFNSVEHAIRKVCDVNSWEYGDVDWEIVKDGEEGENTIGCYAELLLDENLRQADECLLKKFDDGEINLYRCWARIYVAHD